MKVVGGDRINLETGEARCVNTHEIHSRLACVFVGITCFTASDGNN